MSSSVFHVHTVQQLQILMLLLIQPSFLTTCPNQRSRLYHNKVCMLLIPSFLRRESELIWYFKRTLHVHRIIARLLRCTNTHWHTTRQCGYTCCIFAHVMYERACEVNIGKSSQNLPHADRILVITLKSQPPPAPIVLQGSRMNQQHTVFYHKKPFIMRYPVNRAVPSATTVIRVRF